MAIFKIKDGFSIVDSNNVESQQISNIATAISGNPSHTKIPTEKAVADAIATGGGGGYPFVWKYEPRKMAPFRLSFDPAGATNRTLCWTESLPPGLSFSKVLLFPDWSYSRDNHQVPARSGWAVYRVPRYYIRSISSKGEHYAKNACTWDYNQDFFEIESDSVTIPDDEYIYYIAIMVSSFYISSFSLNINLVGTDPNTWTQITNISLPAGVMTAYTDISFLHGYATDGTMSVLPDNYVATGNFNSSPYNTRLALPWYALK